MLAVVGGVGKYQDNQWNRALYPHTAGSSFKPFVYLAGLMHGVLEPDTMINDAPLSMKDSTGKEWAPKNFDGQFKGWLTVRDALAFSRNICAVRVALAAGLVPVVETAQAAGIKSEMDPYPSLALGACAVSPLEMATAYSTLARNGVYMPPQVIRCIKSADQKSTLALTKTPSNNLPADDVAQLVDLMQDVVRRGTGTQARLPGIAVAGKTGTADGSRDIWFCGFTPDTVTVVWGGSDQNKKIAGNNVTGGTVMAGIWRQYMAAFYATHKPESFAFEPPDTRLASSVPEDDGNDSPEASGNETQESKFGSLERREQNIRALAIKAAEQGIGKAFIVQRLFLPRKPQPVPDEIAVEPGTSSKSEASTEDQVKPVGDENAGVSNDERDYVPLPVSSM